MYHKYFQLNPQHTIPTLMDEDYILWNSHAITPYLVDKYAKDDSSYPKDIYKRKTVNQRLHLNNSIITPILRDVAVGVFTFQY